MADYTSNMGAIPEDPLDKKVAGEDGAVVSIQGDEAEVYLDGEPKEAVDAKFHDNLAETVPRATRKRLASELISAIESDDESRSDWADRLKHGMELLGLKDRSQDEEPFPGASSATHPLIGEAIVQFHARSLPEMIPSEGPVKASSAGERDEELDAQADRVAEYLNYRLTVDDDEWYDDTSQMLFYLPYGGSAFRKIYKDPMTGMAKARYVPAEDFIVPYKAKSLADAQRYTHRFDMHINDIKRAISRGTFIDIELDETSEPSDNNEMADIADKRERSVSDMDGTHRLYECHAYITVEEDNYSEDFDLPYIVTIDEDQGDILSIHRNWDEDDESFTKRVWFAHYKFMPGFGFYGFGLLHMIGGIALAATGALRALLDAAARANMQGGFKSKEARNAKGDTTITPGEWKDIDLTAEELSKAFYTPPWQQPSPALFNLLGTLTDAGQRFSSTTETQVGDASNNAPVGTTVALIEQGSKVFSAIHRSLHRAAGKEYRLFAELDATCMGEDPYPYKTAGESREMRASDFDERIDIIPVSDPNIFSSTQRIALAQAVVQLVGESPDIYGKKEKREAHERLLRALAVPDADELLPDIGAQRRDPVTENQYMMVGKPVYAFPEQDHASHLAVHKHGLQQFGQNNEMQQFVQLMMAHVAEHHAHAYRQKLVAQTGIMLPGGLHPDEEPEELPLEAENIVAREIAKRVQQVPSPAERQAQSEQQEMGADQKRKNAETQAEIKRKDMAAQAEQARKQKEWQADMQRKGMTMEADGKQDQAEFRGEQQRDQAEFMGEQKRDQAEWVAEQRRKQAEWDAEKARKTAEDEDEARKTAEDERVQNKSLAKQNIKRSLDGYKGKES